jgi:hypothetical protein
MTIEIETPNASENELARICKRITELEQTVIEKFNDTAAEPRTACRVR